MHNYLKHTAFAGALILVLGLLFSPAMQSIGTAIIFLHPFLNGEIKDAYKALRKNALALILIAYYLLIFISIFYTSDFKAFWSQNIILKLPFLLIPIGLCNGGGFNKNTLKYVLYFFTAIVWLVATATFINYILHFSEINEQITRSKPIPVITCTNKVLSHIYFGVMMAFSTGIAYYYSWIEKPGNKALKWIFRSIFFTFIIYLNSITARTGMLAFYAAVLIVIIWLMWQARSFLLGFSILSGIGLVLAASLYFVPSLNNRLANTQKDINQYTEGKELNHYSISMRLESYKTAWKVYKKSPLLGVGPADIVPEMEKQYEADKSPLTEENRKLPHNQFLQTLTSLGIPGFLLLLALFIYPFYKRRAFFSQNNFQLLFLAFLVICFFSFQAESVLERQLGVTFFSFFYILLSSRNILAHEN